MITGVNPWDAGVCRKDIEACLSPRTAGIMAVHYGGLPVDIDPIIELGLPVIEDAAHAIDAQSQGRSCGGIGDVGIYSFDSVKNLAVDEGGGLTVRDTSLINRIKQLRYCGIGKSGFQVAQSTSVQSQWWEYDIREPFIKMLPTDIAAAIGLVQLERLDALQTRRQEIWDAYQRELAHISEVTLPTGASSGDRHGYFKFCIRVPRRNDLAVHLLQEGIYTTLRYHPLHLNDIYSQSGRRLKNCERLNQEALSIPLHPRLSNDDAEKVIRAIRQFYRR